MKKLVCSVLLLIVLLSGYNVYARDNVYSYNKFSEENLEMILETDKNEVVVAGNYKDSEEKTQVFVIMYESTGKILWKYINEQEEDNVVTGIINTYDENHEKNGYLVLIKENDKAPVFTRLDLEGKLVSEINSSLSVNTTINKVIEVSDGFIVTGAKDNKAFIAKYDYNFNLLMINEYTDDSTSIIDVISLKDSFYGIKKTTVDDSNSYLLLKFDSYLNEVSIVKEDFEINQEPHLLGLDKAYILYGLSKEIKTSKDKIGGYYLIKYNDQDTEEWETVGDSPADLEKTIKVQGIYDNNKLLKEYYVLSTNSSDNSIEVVRVTLDGLIGDKVKKIKNNYYTVNDYLYKNNILYFVGQINCPEDDNCDYDANSLLLVSTEDKVIEVKDNDSKNIIIGTVIISISVILMYIVRKKYKLNKKKQ